MARREPNTPVKADVRGDIQDSDSVPGVEAEGLSIEELQGMFVFCNEQMIESW